MLQRSSDRAEGRQGVLVPTSVMNLRLLLAATSRCYPKLAFVSEKSSSEGGLVEKL